LLTFFLWQRKNVSKVVLLNTVASKVLILTKSSNLSSELQRSSRKVRFNIERSVKLWPTEKEQLHCPSVG